MGNELFYPIVFLCSLFASAAWCLARPNSLSSGAVAVSSVLWLVRNGSLEGAILYTFTPGRGLTESDLLAIVGVGISVWGFRTTFRRNSRRRIKRRV
ncbi:hypothetical protein BKE56_001330 [Rhodococcus sp. M8]|nr:hypothetical protein BKE56_001330 [Rhodococcus sp. M8]